MSSRFYGYPGIRDAALPYVSDVRVESRLRGLNGPAGVALLQDKNAFADALVARGLGDRAPAVFGTIVGGSFRSRGPAADATLAASAEVVVKPLSGNGGRGVRVVPGEEVLSGVWSVAGELLVQERMLQHPAQAAVNPTSLNTLRLLSVRVPGVGPVVAAAVQRWGTLATGAVDNVSAGGLCSHVDLATGRLGPAVGRPVARRRVEHDVHPDTGERVSGSFVPDWAEVLTLVGDLMEAFTEVDHVGWDLCPTDAGVRVVEGNAAVPNLNVFQLHGPFLAQQDGVRRYYVDRGVLPARYAG